MKIMAGMWMSLFLVISIVHCTWPALAQSPTSMEEMLEALPISQDANVSTECPGYQSVLSIGENLELLYGIGSVYERQLYTEWNENNTLERHVPIKVSAETTLREYLDHMCSDDKLAWSIVQNAIHIWPTTAVESKETYLDTVRVSLDLQGVSLLDAAKAWATEVNRNRLPDGHGVGVHHPAVGGDMRGYHTTTESLTRPGMVSIKLDNVTAREALCAIQGVAGEWVRISYSHSPNREDRILLVPSKADLLATPEITFEERQALNVRENLASVLVEPEAKE